MAGLKPFRKIPENIVEWTKWMRDQIILTPAEVQESIDDINATTTWSDISAYGEMHINGNSTATTVSILDTWYQIVAGWTAGDLSSITFSTDELMVGVTGEYMVSVSMSFTGGVNDTFSFAIAKNDVVDVNTLIERKTSTTDVGALALTGIFTLTDGNTITLWGKDQATTDDFTVTEAVLTVVRIG